MAQSLVPVIDIAPFLAGGAEDKARVAAEVDDACREIGFLVIAGHGVAQAQIDEMRRMTRAFFELPHWEKLRVKMPPDRYRGLMTVGSEDTAYSMDEEENAPDWRESFVIGPHDHDYDEYHYGPQGWRFFAANLWPDRPAGMRPLWEVYYREMERLAGDLMRIFACALGLPETFFADKIDRHITNFIASYYPPQTTPPLPGQLRCGAHADYGSLTIVSSDTPVGGLQVLGRDGAWSDVPCIPGTFVINLGDLMAEWTNDRWRSTLHRVVNPPREEAESSRLSLLFFHQPNYGAVIECLPSCTDAANPPRYGTITSGAHVARKIDLSRRPLLEAAETAAG